MRVRRPFLLPALAALLGMWLPLVAAAEDVIPPGRESFFVGLCQQPLAGGCASDGISLQKDHAILTFRCPAPLSVELYAPSANRTAALKTAKFLLVTAQPSQWPTGALESLADRLRASEAKWEWLHVEEGVVTPHEQPSPGHLPPPPGITRGPKPSALELGLGAVGLRGRYGLCVGLLLACGTFLWGLTLWVRAPASTRVVTAEAMSWRDMIAFGPLITALALASLMLSRFRLLEDDYWWLLQAADHPWAVDRGIRFFTCTLPFQLGLRFGGGNYPGVSTGFFALLVGMSYLACLAGLSALLRRIGYRLSEALLAAGMLGMTPSILLLLRQAISLQPLCILALTFGLLLLVDSAANEENPRRRRALTAMALGLAGVSVFVKAPVTVVLPPMAWIWGRFMVKQPKGAYRSHAFYLLFVVAIAVPLLCAHPLGRDQGELEKAGLSGLQKNLPLLAGWLWPSMRRLLTVVGLVIGTGGLSWWMARRAGRRTRPLPAVSLLVLAALAVAPYMLNVRYFPSYYVMPSLAWLGAIAAGVMSRFALDFRGWALIQGLMAATLLLPRQELTAELKDSPVNRIEAVLSGVRQQTRSRPAPCGVVLRARCSTPPAVAASKAELAEMFHRTDEGSAFRWATGWHETETVLEGQPLTSGACPQPLFIDYCRGQDVRVVSSP